MKRAKRRFPQPKAMSHLQRLKAGLAPFAEGSFSEHEAVGTSEAEVVEGHDDRDPASLGREMHCRSDGRVDIVQMDDIRLELIYDLLDGSLPGHRVEHPRRGGWPS
jgi:hypothetical protein